VPVRIIRLPERVVNAAELQFGKDEHLSDAIVQIRREPLPFFGSHSLGNILSVERLTIHSCH
jgi:hypothetical protein